MRPPNIVNPEPGQESVWDYPWPPRVESVAAPVRVEFGGRVLAESVRALRVCETSSPPVGGWVTPDLVGPFKGVPGSEAW